MARAEVADHGQATLRRGSFTGYGACSFAYSAEEEGLPALVEIESSGGKLLFEGDASEVVLREMAVGDKVKDAIATTQTKMAEVGSTISACTRDLLSVFDDLATDNRDGGSFSSAVIELGVKVTAEGNVVVAKGSVEANLKVTLNWDFS